MRQNVEGPCECERTLRYVQEARRLAYGGNEMSGKSNGEKGRVNIDVIDCPCLSETPSQLRDVLADYDAIVFADVCKAGPQFPLAGMIADLQSIGDLPIHWQAVGAVNTYNPLGNTSTFLNESDVFLEKKRQGCTTQKTGWGCTKPSISNPNPPFTITIHQIIQSSDF